MSLFFLHLCLFTYLLTQIWARRAKPLGEAQFSQSFTFRGEPKEFMRRVQKWVAENPRLDFIELSESSCVISEKPRLFSYGYFYHFHIDAAKDFTRITLKAETRFISAPGDKKQVEKNILNDLDLEKAA
ncbi:MAG: hypothetical protein KDD33_09320 [Bdellovibrionales bacterium]|nr:hypothetical protein [Bdellovibrionales bacterium]